MTWLDRALQDWRIVTARKSLRRHDRVLDIGCADGALFRRLGWLRDGVGVDPNAPETALPGGHRLLRGLFPGALTGSEGTFDAITALAVFEHVPQAEGKSFAAACRRLLRPGGRVIMTVPAPTVDHMLHLLGALHLVAGMELHQHWGLVPADVPAIFQAAGLHLADHVRFELGLNHLFVFVAPT